MLVWQLLLGAAILLAWQAGVSAGVSQTHPPPWVKPTGAEARKTNGTANRIACIKPSRAYFRPQPAISVAPRELKSSGIPA